MLHMRMEQVDEVSLGNVLVFPSAGVLDFFHAKHSGTLLVKTW